MLKIFFEKMLQKNLTFSDLKRYIKKPCIYILFMIELIFVSGYGGIGRRARFRF
jgi:hypothetical protein